MVLYTLQRRENVPALVKEREIAGYDFIRNSEEACELLNNLANLNDLPEEHVYLLCVNMAGQVVGIFHLSHGACDRAYVDVKAIFTRALLCGGRGIVLAHNHPSGNVAPSNDDYLTIERIKDAGNLMGVELLDFIIVGGRAYYYSAKTEGLLA